MKDGQTTVVENNLMIDRFIGQTGLVVKYPPNEYHKDWNLMMSVVRRIDTMGSGHPKSEDLRGALGTGIKGVVYTELLKYVKTF